VLLYHSDSVPSPSVCRDPNLYSRQLLHGIDSTRALFSPPPVLLQSPKLRYICWWVHRYRARFLHGRDHDFPPLASSVPVAAARCRSGGPCRIDRAIRLLDEYRDRLLYLQRSPFCSRMPFRRLHDSESPHRLSVTRQAGTHVNINKQDYRPKLLGTLIPPYITAAT